MNKIRELAADRDQKMEEIEAAAQEKLAKEAAAEAAAEAVSETVAEGAE